MIRANQSYTDGTTEVKVLHVGFHTRNSKTTTVVCVEHLNGPRQGQSRRVFLHELNGFQPVTTQPTRKRFLGWF